MKKTAYLLIALALILSVSSAIFGQNRPLDGTEWKLVEANGRAVRNSSAALNFNENSTRITGNTGCNQMFGSVTIRGRSIDFGNIGTTKRMCKLMPGSVTEEAFLKAMNDAVRFTNTRERLSLTDRRGRTLLRFSRVEDVKEAARLDDKKWVLEQIKGRQTFAPLPYAFINFNAKKGSVGGDYSCNVFGGSYSVRGNSIKFSELIATMRACIEDNKMSVEREMLDGLREAKRFEIRHDRLYLYRGDELLLTFFPEAK